VSKDALDDTEQGTKRPLAEYGEMREGLLGPLFVPVSQIQG
jgi:hypothetical protein